MFKMEINKREEKLLVFTKIFILYALAVYLSRVFHDYAYKSLLFKGGFTYGIMTGPAVNIFPKITANTIFYFAVLALMIIACIIGLICVSKGKKQARGSIIAIGAVPLIEIGAILYVIIRAWAVSRKHGWTFSMAVSRKFYITLFAEQFLSITVLVFAVILLIAYGKKLENKVSEAKNTKQGLGGFFIIPIIRNVLMPLNFIAILTAVMFSMFRVRAMQEFVLSNLYAAKMVFIVLMLCVLSIAAIIKMFKKQSKFVPVILSVEIITVVLYMQNLIQSVIRSTSAPVNYSGVVPYIIGSILLIIYYARSSRVKNTFVNE